MRLGWSAAIAMAVAGAAMVGCSGAEAPLGGPYGGTATTDPPPSSGTSGGTNATDGTSATGGTGSSSGGSNNGSSSTSSSSSGSSGGNASSGGSTSNSGGTSSGGTSSSSSGGSSSSSGGSSSGGAAAPTWTQIFNDYLASGTEGNCIGCHGGMSSPSNGYSWLQSKGYLGGSSPALTDPSQSCLSWYGGNMPPNGPSDQKAVSDMNAWASAGAKND